MRQQNGTSNEAATGTRSALRRLREELLELSQPKFARELGISVALLQKLEAGEAPISDTVRRSVRETYAAELTADGVFDLSGNPYGRELVRLLRAVGESRVLRESIKEGLKKDLALLVRAAEENGSMHVLVPRLHGALRRIADDLQLTGVLEGFRERAATVSAGEIRAWERTAPLRRKHDLLKRRIERLEVSGRTIPRREQQLSRLRQEAAELEQKIEERKQNVDVRGRRKLLYHWIGGEAVIIPPSIPNSHRYPVSEPQREFLHWWDDYRKYVMDLCNPPPTEEE
jgi:transcriptional regulator with XRE-family HTH domain